MSSEPLKLKFYHLDIFTTTPYKGNPLAIVHLPPGHDLDRGKKQSIARDFNLSETVFLHESENDGNETRIDIFTPSWEIPFAGHPTIGTGWHLLENGGRREPCGAVTLIAKAGAIPVVPLPTDNGQSRVKLTVPVNFKVHSPHVHPTLKKNQTNLTTNDYVNGSDGQEPIASIVKGMTFLLLQLTSTDALARMIPLAETLLIPGLGDWAPFVLLYAFTIIKEEVGDGNVNGVFHIQARMFCGDFEDPATGSAASTLAGWLAQKKGRGIWAVKIVQGVEMGRRSEIEVVVTIGDDSEEIKTIELIGSAVQVMEGYLLA